MIFEDALEHLIQGLSQSWGEWGSPNSQSHPCCLPGFLGVELEKDPGTPLWRVDVPSNSLAAAANSTQSFRQAAAEAIASPLAESHMPWCRLKGNGGAAAGLCRDGDGGGRKESVVFCG